MNTTQLTTHRWSKLNDSHLLLTRRKIVINPGNDGFEDFLFRWNGQVIRLNERDNLLHTQCKEFLACKRL